MHSRYTVTGAMAPDFASFVVRLTTRFTGLATDEIEETIRESIAELVGLLGTDRATLSDLREDGVIRIRYSHAVPGAPPFPEGSGLRLPWYWGELRAGRVLNLASLPDAVPETATEEQEYVKRSGFRSNLAVPILVAGHHDYAIATGRFDRPHQWSEDDVVRVRTAGQLIAGALTRLRTERRLHELTTRLEAENEYLREESREHHEVAGIVGKSLVLQHVLEQVALVAPTDASVLLQGETGTGKELLANAIHDQSARAKRALVKVNCAAIPASLFESELLGHERGAFTGATATRLGRFELADGGTLFLDEVGELPLEMQAKLLRVLQDGKFERLGSMTTRRADVRVVAATNRDLEQAVQAGRFRQDLYFRLSAFPIRVPALRERKEDIPLLVWACIERRQAALGRRITRLSRATMQHLTTYSWPGNVRELENVLERALIRSTGTELLVETLRGDESGPADQTLAEVEKAHIAAVLRDARWRINGAGNAAERLGLHPNTLRFRMKKLGIRRPARTGRRTG
ncbi:MAG TPA: sigma 54-interacting transcriptional regulator [Gemmatimonadales bacterium]